MGGASASDEAVRALAAEILSRDEYAGLHGDLAAWEAFFRWIGGFFDWVEELRVASPALFGLLFAALAAVAVALLVHAIWTIRVALLVPAPAPREGGTQPRPDLPARAAQLAREGRFLEAARQLQLVTLEGLLERGLLDLARSETNRVLRARLARAPLAERDREALLAALNRLEAALFREHRDDPALYEQWRSLHQRLFGVHLPVAP